MDIVALVEFLVKSIVKEPNMVSVKAFEDDSEYQTIEVIVASDDMGAVIGKDGKVASSIRTIVKSAAYANGLKKVNINFDTF
jgi:hypothetical protein